MSTVTTRQQKIAALEKELSALSQAQLNDDLEHAKERLRQASLAVAKIKRELERAEAERTTARALLSDLEAKADKNPAPSKGPTG